MKTQVKQISKELEENEETLEQQIELNTKLLEQSPELLKIEQPELEKIELMHKKKLSDTPSSRLQSQIDVEFGIKEEEEKKIFAEELSIHKNGYEFQLLVSNQTIDNLKKDIKFKNNLLATFRVNAIRYESNIKKIKEILAGICDHKKYDINLEQLESGFHKIQEVLQDVEIDEDYVFLLPDDYNDDDNFTGKL